MEKRFHLSSAIVFLSAVCFAQDGQLDGSFAVDGFAITDVGPYDRNVIRQLVVRPDGRFVGVGHTWNSTDFDFALVQYLPNGEPDPSFGSNGQVTTDFDGAFDQANCMALLPDGKLVVAGTSGTVKVVRYLPNGVIDQTFGTNGWIGLDGNRQLAALDVLEDGSLLLCGSLYSEEWTYDQALTKLTPNGSLDISFGNGGNATLDIDQHYELGDAITLQPDGKILMAGFTNWNDANNAFQDIVISRYFANGVLDPAFGTNGKVQVDVDPVGNSMDYVNDMALQSDGKIVLGCMIINSGDWDLGVLRLNPNGTMDNSFGTNGQVVIDHNLQSQNVQDVEVLADGKILAGGYAYHKMALWRLLADGTLDPTFGDGGLSRPSVDPASYDYGYTMAVQPSGKVLLAGSTTHQCLLNTNLVARFENEITVSMPEVEREDQFIALFPTPTLENAVLRFHLDEPSAVSIEVRDASGRLLRSSLAQTKYGAGTHTVEVQLADQAPGLYEVTLSTQRSSRSVRAIKQ